MKIICDDCGNEFNINHSNEVEILGTTEIELECECGGNVFYLRK